MRSGPDSLWLDDLAVGAVAGLAQVPGQVSHFDRQPDQDAVRGRGHPAQPSDRPSARVQGQQVSDHGYLRA